MNNPDQPSDPFADFINSSLDMDGIDGLGQAVMAEKVRAILRGLPSSVTSELWNDRLDELQAVIRVCLDLQTVLGAFEEQPDANGFNKDDLEILIMLSVTFAFVSYNQLRPAYGGGEPHADDHLLMARRLRETLQVAVGWVKRAGREGDPVAARLAQEIDELLHSAKRLDE
ncbi:MAG TPA: hypothetical protein VHD90_06920 [Phototrophicaceae bacterium]|nr:hypothetical protein [Phototrophicaceae bacterium]